MKRYLTLSESNLPVYYIDSFEGGWLVFNWTRVRCGLGGGRGVSKFISLNRRGSTTNPLSMTILASTRVGVKGARAYSF